jgi:CP family cyanate transporter-like MFS transporter
MVSNISHRTKITVSLAALMFLAANLRPALTSVGPLIEEIRQTTGISLAAAGLLTSLPLVAFGALAPLAQFGRRFGMERTLGVALVLLTVGILMRSEGSVAALFAGSLCLAGGIAVGNVLVPSLIKRDFPHRVKGVTTLYAVMLNLMPAISTGVVVPLSDWLPGGWRSALAVWAIPAAAALLLWLPAAMRPPQDSQAPRQSGSLPIWRSGLAWQVTAFMGLQSLSFYITITWIPAILHVHGISAAEAGLLMSLYQLVALASLPGVPVLLRLARDQTALSVACSLLILLSVCGFLFFPAGAYLWIVTMGVGSGVSLTLALSFISLRAADHHEAAALSVMSQSVGYLLAAAGTFCCGLVHDLSGGWTIPLVLWALIALTQTLVGIGAGRNRTVSLGQFGHPAKAPLDPMGHIK